MQAGKRRCEVTVVTAVVGFGEKVATDKVRELEILVDGKRFEDEWNKPVTFSVASTLPPDTGHVKIVVLDSIQPAHRYRGYPARGRACSAQWKTEQYSGRILRYV